MRKSKIRWINVAMGIFLCVIAMFVFWKMFYIKEEKIIEKTDKVFYNPLMGFAVNADYPEAVEENTLVYVDITWREWEPKEGQYAFKEVWEENNLTRWRQEGKHIVLRFICDKPGDEAHMDIPDWLYEETKDGEFYDIAYGKGYAPEYENELFIEKHREAILAMGEAFKECGMVAYVEMGSLGHWGEWHMLYTEGTTRIPSEEIRKQYVAAYEEAFPYAHIMARRPFAETAELGLGLFNDMTGHLEDTKEWLEWIAGGGTYDQPLKEEKLTAQPEVWKKAPIGGEFTSSLSYEEMLDADLEQTLSLLQQSHTTFIGPKVPILEEVTEYQSGVNEVLKTIGYRYGVVKSVLSRFKWETQGTLTLTVENGGIAPIYFPWKMYLYVYEGAERIERIEVPVDLMKVCGGESVEVSVKDIPLGDNIKYGICIENPDAGKPGIELDMAVEAEDKIYMLPY